MLTYRDATTRRQRLEQLRASLWSDRSSFDAHWKELADFYFPRRTRFTTSDRNRGDKRNQNIINSTGRYAARTLQSGLHAGLTSPARPWLKLAVPDQDLEKFAPVKDWLHKTTERMLTLFSLSNLYNVLPIVYGDMGVFGTAAMSILEDDKDLFRAEAYPVGSYAVGVDRKGKVSTFVREYELSVRQIVEEYGLKADGRTIDWSNISLTVRNLWDRGNYEASIGVTWIVYPNEERDDHALESKYKAFASCHFETGGNENKFLREGGFDTFPIMVPRWDVTSGDSYGTDCPGMTALGDVKQLQIMERRKGQALAKLVDPPLVGPTSLRTQKTSMLPGDVTFVDVREGMQGLKSVHDIRIDFSHLQIDMQGVEYRIKRAFFEDLFIMLGTSDPMRGAQPITAREVEERHEEKLIALGPVLERTNDELLDPLIDRVFMLMAQAGFFDEHGLPPPPELQGVRTKAEYISILSQAQKLVSVTGQDRFLQSTIPLLELAPEVGASINFRQVVKNYADMLGVDPELVRSDEEVTAILQAQQQQQQQAAQAEQAAQLATAVQKAGATKMGQDSALDRLVGGIAGSGVAS
jgi:hypothetical protein